LTPELRTRLSAVERTVGWFVMLATIVLVAGFAFYIVQSGKNKGWFITKINYATSLNDASGLNVGDPVRLMGFNIGQITRIDLNPPLRQYGVTVFFWIREPYPGYIWLDSRVRENQDFLGHSSLEVLKGYTGAATAYRDPNKKQWMVLRSRDAWEKFQDLTLTNHADSIQASNILKGLIESNKPTYYVALHEGKFDQPPDESLHNYCFITPLDSPTLSERLATVAGTVEGALPNILNLTNQLAAVLTNAAAAVARLDRTLADLHPTVTNLNAITGNLTNGDGSLGNWLIPTNLSAQLHDTLENASATLATAHATLDNADTNLLAVATDLDKTLEHLSDLTSNLAWQVQGNTNLVGSVAKIIVDTDDLVQGLKRHWLLRSAFKHKEPKKAEKDPSH
jgi:ABC-type transporter Mla subunit MlaD